VSQLKVINTGHGASYINSSFIYPSCELLSADKWVTLELARTM